MTRTSSESTEPAPSTRSGTARVTLLFEDGTAAAKSFTLFGSSRLNVDVRREFPPAIDRRFGVVVDSLGGFFITPVPIVVERAMYSNARGVTWAAGTSAVAERVQ